MQKTHNPKSLLKTTTANQLMSNDSLAEDQGSPWAWTKKEIIFSFFLKDIALSGIQIRGAGKLYST